MKKAIVTGASGFLGRYLIKELTRNGVEVIAVVKDDKSDVSELQELSMVRIVECPLQDILSLLKLVSDRDIDVMYHFAWTGTSGNERSDIDMQLSNVGATCNAVRVASEMGCRRFVHAGSIMSYEAINYIPLDGVLPFPGNIYSTAKLAAEYMSKTLAASLNLEYINCIISNVYGVGEKSARFINSTIRKFINKEKVSFTEGNQLYDFIYITDAAKAFYLVGVKGKSYHNYYIGNQQPQSLKSYIITIRDIIDQDIELKLGELPFHGALLQYNEFDTKKLYQDLDFRTEITFKQGIRMTVDWIKKNNQLTGG